MRAIRKLYIQNAKGERKGLNGEHGVYSSALSGFGFFRSPAFADIGSGFFMPVNDETDPQSKLAFVIHFTRNGYRAYQDFVNWISAAGDLTIVYSPTGDQEFFRSISFDSLQKGELNSVGWLEIPCSCVCTSPWFLPTPLPLILEAGNEDNCKRYDYMYAEALHYGFDSPEVMIGTVQGAGHIPAALSLTYYGAVTNPRIRLVGDISGKNYGICSVQTTLQSTEMLVFSTRYTDSFVEKISATGERTDLLDELDLTTEPFFHIPVDEPCSIMVEADSPLPGYAELLIYYYYRSV